MATDDPLTVLRREPRQTDVDAVRRLVASTGFFHAPEVAIAAELVEEALADPQSAGYHFLFADGPEPEVAAYSCFGPIPMTVASWDLYWIAVDPRRQGSGLGRRLLRESESAAREAGAEQLFVETSGREHYAPTRAFYERCGYTKVAEIDDFYAPGDSKVLYCLRLGRKANEGC